MSDMEQQLLQISAKLYQQLCITPSATEERDDFFKEVDRLLEERGKLIESIRVQQIQLDFSSKNKAILIELDKGILERLQNVMGLVKNDLKTLQVSKKKKEQYINPYSSVHVMDGKYYDRKK